MKNNIINILIATILLMFTYTAAAQELRSSYFMKTANYNHQINPALLQESYIGMPILGNINIGTKGNVGLSNFVYKLEGNSQYKNTTFMNPKISSDDFLGDLNDENKINANINVSLLSVAFKGFNGFNVIELNLRSKTSMDLPYDLFEFMKITGSKEEYIIDDLSMHSQNYAELVLGHSHKINENLTVGAKMKFLFGMAYANAEVNKMSIKMNGDKWVINSDANIEMNLMDANFEYDDYDPATTQVGRKKINDINTDDMSFSIPGIGLAFDLGATYKIESIEGLTLSASATDLGFISWSSTKKASSKGEYTFDGFDNSIYTTGTNTGDNKISDQWDAVSDDLEKLFSLYEEEEGTVSQALAATINIGAQYTMPFYDKLSAGFLFTSRIDGAYSWSQVMLSANYRSLKWLELNLNTSASCYGMCLGGMINIHTKNVNFFVGSDCLFSNVSKNYIPLNNFNSNICLGLNFPVSF